MTEYLYLIRCKQEAFKIGIASDVRSRVASLQTGNPYKLELAACYSFPSAEAVERVLHMKFDAVRMVGEWFRLSDNQLYEFTQICQMLDGRPQDVNNGITPDEIEEAEEIQETFEYSPTIEDVQRLMNDPTYRLEYRYGDNGLRGFAWRKRSGNKECPLYIGKRSPIFEQVRAMLPEHHLQQVGE
jgi:hypothetical protein